MSSNTSLNASEERAANAQALVVSLLDDLR